MINHKINNNLDLYILFEYNKSKLKYKMAKNLLKKYLYIIIINI